MYDKRVKQRYGVECNCGNYKPYLEVLKEKPDGHAVARILKDYDCYNCYLKKRYGSNNPDIVKETKKQETIQRMETLNQRLKGKKVLRE